MRAFVWTIALALLAQACGRPDPVVSVKNLITTPSSFPGEPLETC